MMAKLKNRIKKVGIATVASELGYRSQASIQIWLTKNVIPKSKKEQVKKYLSEVK